ncbi:MAG: hypothetical protein JWO15_3682 [Sphingomonadales bacterium]|nr:hypothetical protein [Sphingomonadales bacterium]
MPLDRDGTPMQRGLLEDRLHHKTNHLSVNKKGIVLEVKYSDHAGNRSAQSKNDRRGWLHEAKVWLVEDCAVLEHVIIAPSGPSGLDDYEENLPRASTRSVDGIHVDENLSTVDPNDLDGDWCVVSFMEGRMRDPFISNWWPNPRNVFDPATSGKGNPKLGTGKGTALDQRGRYFKRTNGIEHTITPEGNIILSTSRAGTKIKPGSTSSDGRFPRSTFDGGGSIITYIKPSQSLEITFDQQVDGIGSEGLYESSLPQRNPVMAPPKPTAIVNTKVKCTSSEIKISVPKSIQVRSKVTALVEAPDIYLGENAIDFAAMTIPTMANFNALVAVVNALVGVVKVPTPVVTAPTPGPATVPTAAALALMPVAAMTDVACKKVHIE